MKSAKSRKAVYGVNLVVMIVAMLVVLGIINWLGNKHYKRWDLAEPSSKALSKQTINVLKNLREDVTVTYFYTFSPYEDVERKRKEWEDLLERYKSLSKHFDYEMIDYAKNPQRVNNFFKNTKKISLSENSSVVQAGKFVEKIDDTTESALTGAIIKVTHGEERVVCFTEGHGEHDPDSSGTGGYDKARRGLEAENFKVRKIELARDGVPAECDVVVIAGPVLPFKAEETSLLQDWVDKAGKLLVMLDATGRTGLESLLEKYRIIPEDDVLKTEKLAALGQDPFWIMADTYNPTHKITSAISQIGMIVGDRVRTLPAYLYEVRSLKIKDEGNTGIKAEELITTNDNVRVLPSEKAPFASQYHASRSKAGSGAGRAAGEKAPIGEVGAQVVAAYSMKTVEEENPASTKETKVEKKPEKTTRIVVFGDSDFAADGFIEQVPNGDIFLNTMAWLGEEEESIGIRPKKKKFIPIHFGGSRNWLILTGVLVLVPLVVLVNGFLVWRERKRL